MSDSTPDRPRVLLVAPHTEWIFQNLVPSLRRLTATTFAYPIGNYMGSWHLLPDWESLRRRLVDRFLADLESIHRERSIDLVLNMQYDDTFRAADLRRIRRLGIPVATYHVDMNQQWYRVLRQARELDLLAVSHREHLGPFERAGIPIHFMPMAASPDRYLVEPDPAVPAHDVLMLGRATSHRVTAVAACLDATNRVDVYGSGWDRSTPAAATSRPAPRLNRWAKARFDLRYLIPRLRLEGTAGLRRRGAAATDAERTAAQRARQHGYAPDDQVASLMARAAILLGVNQRTGRIGDPNGVADSRLRDFEAPLCGAFYLVQSYPDLQLFYEPGVEVAAWSTLDELREKIRWYLDRPDDRAAIARAGHDRARRDHTWDARLSELLEHMGLTPRTGGTLAPLHVVANLGQLPWCGDSPGCAPDDPSSVEPAIDAAGGYAGSSS